MLITFEVENFRSIRNRAELSLVAVNYYKEQIEQLITDRLPGLSGTRFLRSAAVFGPNASGKSTLFQALTIMRGIVLRSLQTPEGAGLPYRPYLLDSYSKDAPTTFFAAFVHEGVRYEYCFSYTADAIVSERLSAFPKGREQVWFTRETVESKNSKDAIQTSVKASKHLGVPAALVPLLNGNGLLLTLLANYPNYAESAKVRPVFDWFAGGLSILDRGPRSDADFPFSGEIVDGAQGSDFQREFIQRMMRHADVGISATRVERRPLPEALRSPEMARIFGGIDLGDEAKAVVFDHDTPDGPVKLELGDESDGTYQLFLLSGHVAQALERGSTLFVDELDASLHPVLVREVISCFLDPTCNLRGAQLVFTAHNPCLLEDGLLRRDQVWFTEKGAGGTVLYPLSDFKPYKDEALERGYLMGRYSATPVVPACFGCGGVSCAKGTDDE